GGNPNQIILMGHSSGGHLVSLLATDRQYLAAQQLSLDAIKGVITLSGVYDLRNSGIIYASVFGGLGSLWHHPALRGPRKKGHHLEGTHPSNDAAANACRLHDGRPVAGPSAACGAAGNTARLFWGALSSRQR